MIKFLVGITTSIYQLKNNYSIFNIKNIMNEEIRKQIEKIKNWKQFLNEQHSEIKICDLNMEYVKNNYDEELFGNFTEEGMNKKISKCLCKNDEFIGYYLLNKQSMLEAIKYVFYWVKEKKYKDLKWFVTKDELNKYKNRKGIFGKSLFVDKKYRNQNYGNVLINYSKSLGDYNWGVTIKGDIDDYWVKHRNRIKICEWTEQDGSVSVLTATKI